VQVGNLSKTQKVKHGNQNKKEIWLMELNALHIYLYMIKTPESDSWLHFKTSYGFPVKIEMVVTNEIRESSFLM